MHDLICLYHVSPANRHKLVRYSFRAVRKAEAAGAPGVEALRALSLGDATALAAAWVWEHASEALLAAALLRFGEVVAGIQEDLMPHRMCEFMFGLAGKATDFIRDCNVLGEGTRPALRDSRLRLVVVTVDTLTTCMRLLGIHSLDRI